MSKSKLDTHEKKRSSLKKRTQSGESMGSPKRASVTTSGRGQAGFHLGRAGTAPNLDVEGLQVMMCLGG